MRNEITGAAGGSRKRNALVWDWAVGKPELGRCLFRVVRGHLTRGITSRSGHEVVFKMETAMRLDAAHVDAKLLLAMLEEELPQKIRHFGIGELVPGHVLLTEIADLERFGAGPAAVAFHDTTKDDVNLADGGQAEAGYAIEHKFLGVDLYTGLFESLACSGLFEGLTPLHEPGRRSPGAQRGLVRSPTQQQAIAACQHQGNEDSRVLIPNCAACPAKEPLALFGGNPACFETGAAFRTIFHEVTYRHSSNARQDSATVALAQEVNCGLIAYNRAGLH